MGWAGTSGTGTISRRRPATHPLRPMAGAALGWAGTNVVFLRGGALRTGQYDQAMVGGMVFDPASGAAEALPPGPLPAEPAARVRAQWTGSELLAWNGYGAASWNRVSNSWRRHDAVPAGASNAVWTGTRLEAWEARVSYWPSDGDVAAWRPFPVLSVGPWPPAHLPVWWYRCRHPTMACSAGPVGATADRGGAWNRTDQSGNG